MVNRTVGHTAISEIIARNITAKHINIIISDISSSNYLNSSNTLQYYS